MTLTSRQLQSIYDACCTLARYLRFGGDERFSDDFTEDDLFHDLWTAFEHSQATEAITIQAILKADGGRVEVDFFRDGRRVVRPAKA